MNSRFARTNKGFTLIEVLIALVVAVVGILAMIQLSGAFLQSVSDSDRRTVAYALAERTLEDLRAFDTLTGSAAGETFFKDIETGSTADVTVSSGQSTYLFDIVWTVSDSIVSGGVVSATSGIANLDKRLKNVEVVVSWISPEAGSVSLSSLIAGVDPNAAALTSDDLTNAGGDSPNVAHTPGVAPEVIPINVGDGRLKETTKPVPEVDSKNYSTEVKFETITYDPTDSNFQEIQEDFITVNCICNLSTSGTTVSPAYLKYDSGSGTLIDVLGSSVSSATGTEGTLGGGNSQSDYCERCCANHHDGALSAIKYSIDAGNAADGHDHRHYKVSDDTTDPLTLVEAGPTEDYLEACRFKRINGIYRLVPDWTLLEVNVFPATYLAASTSELTAYQAYIQDYVVSAAYSQLGASSLAAAAGLSASMAQPSLSMDTTSNNSNQALSRSLYLENPSTVEGLSAYLQGLAAASIAADATNLIMGVLPFYEINTSELSMWSTASSGIATVSNTSLGAGAFSRGLIGAVTAGSTEITASMAQGNTGILGNTFSLTAPSEFAGKDNRITSAAPRTWISGSYNPLPVTVSGGVLGSPYDITVTGSIDEYGSLFKPGDVEVTCQSNGVGIQATVTPSGGNYICTITDEQFGSTVSVSVTVTTNSKDAACDPSLADHVDTSSYQLPSYGGINSGNNSISSADFDVSEVYKVGSGKSATWENYCP